ncbi:MAG: ArsR/SmtB family transcription factor [Bacillota bacterium]
MKKMEREKTHKDVEILKALAHPVRLGIVKVLHEKGELCACEICSLFDCDRTTASKHLAVLRQAGIIDYERYGKMIIYRLEMPCVSVFLRCIQVILKKEGIVDEEVPDIGTGMRKM